MTAAIGGGLAGGHAQRHARGADGMMRLGPAVVLAALVLLAILMPLPGAFGSPAGLAVGALALAAVGFGIGLGWPHLLTRVFNAAPAGQETLTASSVTTVQLYATALTAALAGVITNTRDWPNRAASKARGRPPCGCSPRFPSRPRWP